MSNGASPDLTAALRRARELHQQGHTDAAIAAYDAVLAQSPAEPRALHLRGIIELERGAGATAAHFISRSISIDPQQPTAHSNLCGALLLINRPGEALASAERALHLDPRMGTARYNRAFALQALGRHEEALVAYDAVLALEPGNLEALTNRGDVLRTLSRPAQALQSYARALALNAEFVPALTARGAALLESGDPEPALASIDQALRLAPAHVPALACRGRTMLALERAEEALGCFDEVLRRDPRSLDGHIGRGNVLRAQHRHAEALDSYDRAGRIAPGDFTASFNRAAILHVLRRTAEAISAYDTIIARHPGDATVFRSRGNAQREQGDFDGAIASYSQALRLDPDCADAHFDMANALHLIRRHAEATASFARLLDLDPEYEYAEGSLLFSRMHSADWAHWKEEVELIHQRLAVGRRVVFPFPMLSFTHSAQQQRACAQLYVADRCVPEGQVLPAGEPYAHERIRLAYLSADFREHAVAHVAAGVFEQHDRGRFETIALALQAHPHPSRMRERLRAAFAQFHDVSALSDREAAQLLRRLEVDIAVDLTGHTTGGRPGILAFRPAPIQVNYLGFPGTLGAPYIDYLIADPIVIPAHEEPAYLEHIVRLPHCYLPNDARPAAAPANPPTRSANALPEHGVVFCAFNNTYKINPDLFSVWMRLLQRTPESVLWLRAAEPLVSVNLRREALAWGIAPERLVFAPYLEDLEQHLARYALVDLFLDTLPYNAHATANDALRAGVPVITCRGSTFAGRVAASQLTALGVPELITESLPEYEALAARLASDPQARVQLRAKILAHQNTHPLFNTSLYRHHLESAFLTMHRRHQQRLPPQGFEVL